MEWLQVQPDDLIVDMTLGGGGYARAILARLGKEGRLVAIDRDKDAVESARQAFAGEPRFAAHHAPFSQAADYLRLHRTLGHDGAVFDLGVSSHQLDTAERGFSFRLDGPLDMRMGGDLSAPSAADLVNQSSVAELTRIFRDYGEEKKARAVALAIEEKRRQHPITRTSELASLVEGVVGVARRRPGVPAKHPATRVFQALRIAVNDELGEVERGLRAALQTARVGARLVVVAYHSLEDRLVKNFFRDAAGRCHCPRHLPVCACGARAVVKICTSRPVRPSSAEVERNRRARSALLRVAEKVAEC